MASLESLEEKIDGIINTLQDLKVEQRDLKWIKGIAAGCIPLVITFGAWVAFNIMEIKANAGTPIVAQRSNTDGSDEEP